MCLLLPVQGRASNFGFGLAGDPVAKSIRRNQERRDRDFAFRGRQAPAVPAAPLALPAFREREGVRDLTGQSSAVARLVADAAVNQEKVAKQAENAARSTERRAAKLREIQRYQQQSVASGQNTFNEARGPIGPGNAAGEAAFRRRVAQDRAIEQRAFTFEDRLQRVRERNATERVKAEEAQRLASAKRVQGFLKGVASRAGSAGSGALIGGAFPALFGQGGAVSLGGALGGAAGGLFGGAGSFAGGIAGSAIGQQLDNLTRSLKDPAQAADLLAKTNAKLSANTITAVEELTKAGRAAEAQELVYRRLVEAYGQESVNEFVKADKAISQLGESFGELTGEVVVALTPAITALAVGMKDLAPIIRDVASFVADIQGSRAGRVFNAANLLNPASLLDPQKLLNPGFLLNPSSAFKIPGPVELFGGGGDASGEALKIELGEEALAKDAKARQDAAEKLAKQQEDDAKRLAQLQQRLIEQTYQNQIALQRAQFDAETALLNRRIEITERLIRGEEELLALRTEAGGARDQVTLLLDLFSDLRGNRQEFQNLNRELQSAQLRLQGLQAAPPAMMANPGVGGTQLGSLIGATESYGGNYGAFNRGGRNNGRTAIGSGIDPNLVNTTIAEIQRRQLAPGVPAGQQLHAVGKYQIIGSTLQGLMQGAYGQTGITPNDRFTPENQEILGTALARARVMGQSVEAGMKGLRQEWVGLQNVSDPALRSAVQELQGGGSLSPNMGGAMIADPVGQLGQQGAIDQQSVVVQQFRQELGLLKDSLSELERLAIEKYLERTINFLDDQTTSVTKGTMALKERNRLLMEGFSPEGLITASGLMRSAVKRIGVFRRSDSDEVLQRLVQSGVPEELVRAVVQAQAKKSSGPLLSVLVVLQIEKLKTEEEGRGVDAFLQQQKGIDAENRDLQARINALRDGRVELNASEEAILRYGEAWADATDEQRENMLANARQTDSLRQQLEELQRLRQFSEELGGALSSGVVGGLRDVVAGTRTVKEAFADMLTGIADVFLQQAQRMLAEYLSNQVFKFLSTRWRARPAGGCGRCRRGRQRWGRGDRWCHRQARPDRCVGLASGGPAKAGQPYFVGDNPDGSLNATTELFVPGVSGRVLSAGDTKEYLADAEARAFEAGLDADDGSLDSAGGPTTNINASRSSSQSSSTGDTNSTSSFVQSQAERERQAAMAAGNGDGTSSKSESSLFSATKAMVNNATSTIQRSQSDRQIAQVLESSGSDNQSTTVEWMKIGDLDVVTRDQLVGAMTQAERKGAKRGKEMVLSGMKRDPAFRRDMR